MRHDLGRIGVEFDTWFSERTLHESGEVTAALADLRMRGAVFEADGATWLRTSEFGDSRDRVLIKSDGDPTYLLADLAYHRNKFERGWIHLIDIWGADHHGQVKSLQAGMEALGYPPGEPRGAPRPARPHRAGRADGAAVPRTGNIVTLADILDDVDADVVRLTFLLQSIDTAQTFDLDLVTAQSMDNPVYYVQYAHAADRVDPAQGSRIAASSAFRSSTRTSRRSPTIGSSSCCVRSSNTPRCSRRQQRCAHHTASPRGCATSPRASTGSTETAESCPTTPCSRRRGCGWRKRAGLALASALAILGVHAPEEMSRVDEDG